MSKKELNMIRNNRIDIIMEEIQGGGDLKHPPKNNEDSVDEKSKEVSSDTPSVGESEQNSKQVEEEPKFVLEDRHIKNINKFIDKSNIYLTELDDEQKTEIDIESKTLEMVLDSPILKK